MLAIFLLTVSALLAGPGVSYRSLIDKKDEAAFYAAGGAHHRGVRVHLHVPAARLHARPVQALAVPGIGRLLLFRNRSVPLLVSPGNVYARKIRQRTEPGDVVCVKGVVNAEPFAGPGRFALFVHSLKKATDAKPSGHP